MDSLIRILAEMQGDLFVYACEQKDCSSKFFLKQFANSFLATRFDKIGFVFEDCSIAKMYEELKEEKKLNRGSEIYPREVMQWMGYLLRVWSLTKKISTARLYKLVSPQKLYMAYEAYHSLDIMAAIERICESENIKEINLNDVELYRRIKERNS